MNFQAYALRDFTEVLASASPTPGGGGAAALCGALAAALGSMAGNLSEGKEQGKSSNAELTQLLAQINALREQLLGMVDEDARAFAPLAEAYAMPKETPGRAERLEHALLYAAQSPMSVLKLSGQVIGLLETLFPMSKKMLISDVGCGAAIARAAMESAALNVRVNSKSMKNRSEAEQLNQKAEAILAEYLPGAERLFTCIWEELN